jgi:hypothetical protein
MADASVRGGLADRLRLVRPVDAVALAVESHPARTERVLRASGDHFAGVVVRRIGDASSELEGAGRAGRDVGPDCDRINLDDTAVLNDRELAIGDADDQPPLDRLRLLRLRHRARRDQGHDAQLPSDLLHPPLPVAVRLPHVLAPFAKEKCRAQAKRKPLVFSRLQRRLRAGT